MDDDPGRILARRRILPPDHRGRAGLSALRHAERGEGGRGEPGASLSRPRATPRARLVASLLAIVVFVVSPSARAADPDPWLGRDKALHFGLSAILAGGSYGVSATFTRARYVRLLIGAGVALTAGAAKELYDLSGHGDPSWRDFTWDVIGTAFGLAVAWGLDLAIGGVDNHHPLLAAPPASSAGVTMSGLTVQF